MIHTICMTHQSTSLKEGKYKSKFYSNLTFVVDKRICIVKNLGLFL